MTTQSTLTTTYQVAGMTCAHCASAVTQEINALTGVCHVTVDHATGRAIVTSDRELTHEEIAAAIDEAGYRLAS